MSFLQTARAGADGRELPLVAGLAALLFADGLLGDAGEATVLAVPAVALATVPLLWRRSAPEASLVAVAAGIFACVATLVPEHVVGLPLMISAYSVAVAGDRVRAACAAVVVIAVAFAAVALFIGEGAEWRDAVINGIALLLAVATGDAVRARRAFRRETLAREAEREREQRAESLRMVAEERLRIAQDVHDVVAHAMVAISVQAGTAEHVLDRRPSQARTSLRVIKDAADAALNDLTRTLGLLRDDDDPAPLRPTERATGLEELESLTVPLRGAGVMVDVVIEIGENPIPPAVSAATYRIAQEATTNILRHAGAERASIVVKVSGRDLVLTVEDDGAALAPVGGPVESGSGSGLRGMTERATALGGRLEAGRQPDGTWRVYAVLPFR